MTRQADQSATAARPGTGLDPKDASGGPRSGCPKDSSERNLSLETGDGGRVLRGMRLMMPDGQRLECEYPESKDWAKSWTTRGVGGGCATGEQDWEIVERFGLTAIIEAIIRALSTPARDTDVTDRVRRLVIAARVCAYNEDPPEQSDLTALDKAVEAFAADIPWENVDDA